MSDRRSAERDFDALYRAPAPRVVHLVYAATGDLTLAQDCTQEAYSRAWQRWSEVGTYDDPGAWVRTVARRLTRAGDRVGLLNVGQTPLSRTSRWTTAQLQDLAAVARQGLQRDGVAPATTYAGPALTPRALPSEPCARAAQPGPTRTPAGERRRAGHLG